jgi:hypothetical protein
VHLIEAWFVEAVCGMQIPPEQLRARTPQEMAEALENIGWIILAKKTAC